MGNKEVKKERVSFYVSKEMKDRIVSLANEMGISVSSFLIVAVNDYIKQSSIIEVADMYRMLKSAYEGIEGVEDS